jgi:two-component sensor histidine kinase
MNLSPAIYRILFGPLLLLCAVTGRGQKISNEFKFFEFAESDSFRLTKPLRFYETLCSKTGEHKFTSNYGLLRDKGTQIEMILYTGPNENKKLSRNYIGEDGIRTMYESPGKMVYFVSHENKFFWQPSDYGGYAFAPINISSSDSVKLIISKIWIDPESNIYAGTQNDNFYFIKEGAVMTVYGGQLDSAGNFIVSKGEKVVKQIILAPHAGIYSFAQDVGDKDMIWIGTDRGLFSFNKTTGQSQMVFTNDKFPGTLTVTHIEADSTGNVWFSTRENGMGYYQKHTHTAKFFHGNKKYSINTFCRKSSYEFFVAVTDSIPAIFNTTTGNYLFIHDSIFSKTPNKTTDIKLDGLGNLFVIKGGGLFYTNFYKESKSFAFAPLENTAYAPFITEIMVMGVPYELGNDPKGIKSIRLKYYQNSITIDYSLYALLGYENLQFAWKVDGYIDDWVFVPVSGNARIPAFLNGLSPGKYVFRVKARIGNEDWRPQEAKLEIIITPPFWQTWRFWIIVISGVGLIIGLILWWRISAVKRREREKFAHEKQILELEAKALRSQMNPHFVFNSLNSIKSLIQQDEKDKSVTYLTTFSKLIRTLFNNADKKEISLYDEMETCKLYLQLEAMRFDTKFSYSVNVDDNIDLKSVQVPALIIQPFIENAIWHGIVPRNSGGHVSLNVLRREGAIEVVIDDDGIGREASAQNKSASSLVHQSKGVNLTQSRLELNNLLQQRHAKLELIDKKDVSGQATGTKVIITLKEEI